MRLGPHVQSEQCQCRDRNDEAVAENGDKQEYHGAPRRQGRNGIHNKEREHCHGFDGVDGPPECAADGGGYLKQGRDREERRQDRHRHAA